MPKELEAIRDDKLRIGLLGLKRLFEANAKKMTKDEIMAFDFTFMNIANALLELQAIKEAKPSEAMDRLDGLGFGLWNGDKSIISINGHYFKNAYDTIKQALLKAQKLEKAWEIILGIIKNVEYETEEDLLQACEDVYGKGSKEYELIKEMIE